MRGAVFFLLCVLGTPVPASANEIRIGIAGPMSGSLATLGEQTKRGVQLAVEDLNARGGVLGRRLTVSAQDDACDAGKARAVAANMAGDKIDLVVGHLCSTSSLAAGGIYGPAHILMIDVGAVFGQTTQGGFPTLFRLSATSKSYAQALGRAVMQNNPGARIAIVSDGSDVTRELTGALQTFFAEANGKVVDMETIRTGMTDLSGVLNKLSLSSPDVVICSCFPNDTALLVRQSAEKKLDLFVYGWGRVNSPEFRKAVTGVDGKKMFAIDYAAPPLSDGFQQVLTELRKRNWPPAPATLLAYTAVEIYGDAVKKAESLDARKVASTMHKTRFSSILGGVEFSDSGDRVDPLFSVYQWVGGQPIVSTIPQ